jgi:hypothetical protein
MNNSNEKKQKNLSEFSPEELLLKVGLYDSILVDYKTFNIENRISLDIHNGDEVELTTVRYSDDFQALIKFFNYNGRFNAYCPYCKSIATFACSSNVIDKKLLDNKVFVYSDLHTDPEELPSFKYIMREHLQILIEEKNPFFFYKVVRCTLKDAHEMRFIFKLEDKYDHKSDDSQYLEITKIGQSPSIADLSGGNILKYKSALKGDLFREYNRAIGLFSHGIGIGSFVYLRRIIEVLVNDKFEEVSALLGIDKDAFLRQKFEDRIKTLKHCLPDLLVKNKSLYGILSKGIHELNEDECLDIFSHLKKGIELVLDELVCQKIKCKEEKEFTSFTATKSMQLRK